MLGKFYILLEKFYINRKNLFNFHPRIIPLIGRKAHKVIWPQNKAGKIPDFKYMYLTFLI